MVEDRLQPLFDKVRVRYPFIFDENEKIKLEPKVAAYVVSELQYISFLNTPTDVKGNAYEELVGENLRGDRGEYFTPRNVCDMVCNMVMAMHPTRDITSLKVLDCCCGTGGYLVSWLSNLKKIIEKQEEARHTSKEIIGEKVRERVRKACELNLFGLDINPFLVRTCQMNLVLHGDGSTNVFRVDSVKSPGEWDNQEARNRVPYGKADIVMTNPPFGGKAKIDDSHILDRYELSRWENNDSRSSLPAEQLFMETALNFVKPGGYLAILIPDGILNNPGLSFIRSWLLKRSQLIASIDLPKTTFKASGGVNNPSVLLVRKFTFTEARNAEEGIIHKAYDVFMASPETCGIDNRVAPVYLRHPDGREKQDESGQKIKDDQVSAVAEEFSKWWNTSPPPRKTRITLIKSTICLVFFDGITYNSLSLNKAKHRRLRQQSTVSFSNQSVLLARPSRKLYCAKSRLTNQVKEYLHNERAATKSARGTRSRHRQTIHN